MTLAQMNTMIENGKIATSDIKEYLRYKAPDNVRNNLDQSAMTLCILFCLYYNEADFAEYKAMVANNLDPDGEEVPFV